MANVTTKKINDTKLPSIMVDEFKRQMFAMLLPEDAKTFLCRFVECTIRYLSKYKAKDIHTAAEYRTLTHENALLFGMGADYIPPETDDEEMPGTWVVSAYMNENAEEVQKSFVFDLQNVAFCTEMVGLLGKYAALQLTDPKDFAKVSEVIFFSLKKFMSEMVESSTDDYVLDCETFTVTGSKNADNETIFAIDLNENLKQLIKDDSALEKISLSL